WRLLLTRRELPSISVLLVASLSGAAALVYETVWMRWFRLAFGSTSQAVSATLCAYFLGLAIGAALLVPLALRIYDGFYPALYDGLSGDPLAFLALKMTLALAAMLPCAILLGG